MISLRGLSHRYTPEVAVRLPDVELAEGRHLVVHGSSGSGKSTLLALMAGLLSPTTGQARVAGTDVGALRPRARDAWRAATLGFVPQRLHLGADLDVRRNLQLPYLCAGEPVDAARIADVMARLGIAALAGRRPHELSLGQAQRVALARAVMRRPRLLLADEPTANLDDASAAAALALLHDAATEHGATLVVATHDRRAVDALAGAQALHLTALP